MPGNERQRSRRRGLDGDHAERLGKDRRHDRNLAQRKQVHEVAVLQRSGEERSRRSDSLELGPVVAEADDHGPAPGLAKSLEQDVDALVVEQLSEVENGRLVALEPGLEPLGVALVGEPLFRVGGIRWVAARLLEQALERSRALLGLELVDVDSRRHLVDALDVADHLLEHRADMRRADESGCRLLKRRSPPGGQVGAAAHRVLELGAVRLDRVRSTGSRRNRPAEQDVVGEDEVGRQLGANRSGVRLDVALTLLGRQLLEQPRLEPLVPVEHEDGQEVVRQFGPDDPRAAQVVRARVSLLADDHDLVA